MLRSRYRDSGDSGRTESHSIAEAERVEAERRAELEAPAKAEKAKRIVQAEADGESRRIEADAEAAATLARLRAEAQGEFEKLAKKGEGLKAIVDACGGADEAYRLLMIEHLDHLAEKAAQAIANVKFDKVVIWEGGSDQGKTPGTGGASKFVRDLAGVFPPVMEVMKEIGGIQLPDTILQFVDQDEEEDKEIRVDRNGGKAAAKTKAVAKPSSRNNDDK